MNIPLRRLTPLLLLLLGNVHAAQLVEVRDGATVAIRISGGEPSRIVIRDGRIHKVWGADGKVQMKPDADTGQVYLQPADGWRHRAFSLFVKDDTGAVYTLVVTPVETPAETVTLVRTERRGADRRKAETWETAQPYEITLAELMRRMARGENPEGYSAVDVNRAVRLWEEAELVLRHRYVGGRLEGEVYELTNVDINEMRLDEREFYRDGVLAVAVERHAVPPSERTRIFVIMRGAQ